MIYITALGDNDVDQNVSKTSNIELNAIYFDKFDLIVQLVFCAISR